MSAPYGRRADPRPRNGCLTNALGRSSLARHTHGHLALPLFASAALILRSGYQSKQAGPPPPLEVGVIDVVQKDVPIFGEWVATLDGYMNAQIQPQVTGYVIKQNCKEGLGSLHQPGVFPAAAWLTTGAAAKHRGRRA